MSRSQDRRLAALESRLGTKPAVFHGSFEVHYTEAWPGCEGAPGSEGLVRCQEHGEACRKSVTPLHRPLLRSIVLTGPWVPLD